MVEVKDLIYTNANGTSYTFDTTFDDKKIEFIIKKGTGETREFFAQTVLDPATLIPRSDSIQNGMVNDYHTITVDSDQITHKVSSTQETLDGLQAGHFPLDESTHSYPKGTYAAQVQPDIYAMLDMAINALPSSPTKLKARAAFTEHVVGEMGYQAPPRERGA